MSKIFGNILKTLRINEGYIQKDLSIEMGVSRRTIADWENGTSEPSIDQIVKLAGIFGVSTDYLLGVEPASSGAKDKRKHA